MPKTLALTFSGAGPKRPPLTPCTHALPPHTRSRRRILDQPARQPSPAAQQTKPSHARVAPPPAGLAFRGGSKAAAAHSLVDALDARADAHAPTHRPLEDPLPRVALTPGRRTRGKVRGVCAGAGGARRRGDGEGGVCGAVRAAGAGVGPRSRVEEGGGGEACANRQQREESRPMCVNVDRRQQTRRRCVHVELARKEEVEARGSKSEWRTK